MIVFRVTDDEYYTLMAACRSAGGRNLSEFTRSELRDRLGSDPVALRFGALERRLSEIQMQIQNLLAAVDRGRMEIPAADAATVGKR